MEGEIIWFYIVQFVWSHCSLLSLWKESGFGNSWTFANFSHDVGSTSALLCVFVGDVSVT